jgi:nucleotide-binding universal stress UspA family protein
MSRFQTQNAMPPILTCTDGSPYSPSIYQHAAWAATRMDAPIHILHVIERDPSTTAGDFSGSIGRFLIAFDGGPSALKAVHHAATNPLLQGLEAHLLMTGKPDPDFARALEHAATGLRGAGFQVTADLLPGDPAETISAEVQKRGIDLLVMGAYGHSRIRRLILGSTTTHLIRTCRVPVLLFR